MEVGVGNGDGSEGAVSGRVIGTYLHGPCLARNPQIADVLLGWVVGRDFDPIVEREVEELRAERLAYVRRPAANSYDLAFRGTSSCSVTPTLSTRSCSRPNRGRQTSGSRARSCPS